MRTLAVSLAVTAVLGLSQASARRIDTSVAAVLWTAPADIAQRDLLYGPGGDAAAPQPPLRYVPAELGGTAAKLRLRDRAGTMWIAKLGVEGRPETAASRLLWAAGYASDAGYYFRDLPAADVPKELAADGVLHEVRLEHARDPSLPSDTWRWRDNPFVGTRDFDGLRVMMALMNNWDLKTENNLVYERIEAGGPVAVYEVADLGATFGTDGYVWPESESKGNLAAYRASRFIRRLTPAAVDFACPAVPPLAYLFDLPNWVRRMRMPAVGRGIPRAHARWIGGWLDRLSLAQLGDAFRAGGFGPSEVDGYVAVLRARIARLASL